MENKKDPSETYKLSRDYDRLFKLSSEGHKVVCFVDFSFRGENSKIVRDVARTNFNGTNYDFGVRGTGYSSYNETKEEFINDCTLNNLEFIEPTNLD